jgi:hypothetical protein
MEINPPGVILALLLIGFAATILCMGLLLLLQLLNILRLPAGGIIFYGLLGGIVITFFLFTRDLYCQNQNYEPAETVPDKSL